MATNKKSGRHSTHFLRVLSNTQTKVIKHLRNSGLISDVRFITGSEARIQGPNANDKRRFFSFSEILDVNGWVAGATSEMRLELLRDRIRISLDPLLYQRLGMRGQLQGDGSYLVEVEKDTRQWSRLVERAKDLDTGPFRNGLLDELFKVSAEIPNSSGSFKHFYLDISYEIGDDPIGWADQLGHQLLEPDEGGESRMQVLEGMMTAEELADQLNKIEDRYIVIYKTFLDQTTSVIVQQSKRQPLWILNLSNLPPPQK